MEFQNILSTAQDPLKAVEELLLSISGEYDWGIVFLSGYQRTSALELIEILQRRLPIKNWLGCSCAGVIGTRKELEGSPAVSLMVGRLPGVKIQPMYLTEDVIKDLKSNEDLFKCLEVYPTESPIFVLLPDPFHLNLNKFLQMLNQSYPGCPVVGGLASGAHQPHENILFLNHQTFSHGVVGFILTGNISVETVVSQGCRPIGETFIVTKAQDNIIYELAGRPLYGLLQEVLHKASDRDKLLAQEAIFVGIAMDEYKHGYQRGDFLIRGLMGIDRKSGAGAIADYVKPGQTVQFHVRDNETAREDLDSLLPNAQAIERSKPVGALVFSCNGRGENLFHQKNHDIDLIQQHLGGVPACGFFCAGEIGPVGQQSFLHGFTSSIALFYPGKPVTST